MLIDVKNEGVGATQAVRADHRSGRPENRLKDDRLPPWREKSLKKRANVTDKTMSPLKRWEEARLGRGNQVRKRQQALTLDKENGNDMNSGGMIRTHIGAPV